MENFLVLVMFVVFTTAKGEAVAKSKSSSDSKAESYTPVVEIHPPLISLPHHGIYPPGFSAPIPPHHLDIFHQSQYGHVGEVAKDKHEVKKDFKLVQKETERKGKHLSKVKKVYTDGRGGIQTKTEKLYSDGHGVVEKAHLNDVHSKGVFNEQIYSHYLPHLFPGGHLPYFGHGYPYPHPYHFQGLGLAGHYGNFLAPHSYGHLGYGPPTYGNSATHTVGHAIAHPGVHSGHAETHTLVGHGIKNPIAGHVTHEVAHAHSGPGPHNTAVGYGIGHIQSHIPHGALHFINPIAHAAGPFHHGFPHAAGPLVHAGPLLNGLSPVAAPGVASGHV
ncbi:UNVERIFIED_CONTAM: hypothetical protein RMT77_005785 [Armadillidium vulgare]